jgi:DNA-binding transcriptional regulator YhcF (GntR family)
MQGPCESGEPLPRSPAQRATRANEPPHQNINPTSTRDISINISSIKAALAAIESLQPGEQFSYRQIAAQYHCNQTTLARRHKAISVSRENEAQNQQALYPQQEQELVRYIERLTGQGLPPTQPIIRRFASQIAKKELKKG